MSGIKLGFMPSSNVVERSKWIHTLLKIILLTIAIDMGGQLGARNIVLPMCLALWIFIRPPVLPVRLRCLFVGLFLMLVLYPTMLLLYGLLQGADPHVAFSQYQSTVLAFFLMIIMSNFDFDKLATILYWSLLITALSAIVIAISLLLGYTIFVDLLKQFQADAGGFFGIQAIGDDIFPNIYFKSTLFFVPTGFYFLAKRHYLGYAICLLGLIFALSKSGMVVLVTGGIIYWLFVKTRALSKILFLGSMVIVFIAILYLPILNVFTGLAGSYTADVRRLHFESISKLFIDHPLNLLFGFGLGTSFYSTGAGEFVTNIELDHLNCIRKYGLIWFCVFSGFIVSISIKAMSSKNQTIKTLGICLSVSFLVAGTNPVLISPVFFLILWVTILSVYKINMENVNVK